MPIKIHVTQYAENFPYMADKLIVIFKLNSAGVSPSRRAIFERFVTYTEYIFKIGSLLYCSSPFSYFIYPLYMYIYENEFVTLLPLYLPKVDEQTIFGYCLLAIFHTLLVVFATFATIGSDFFFIMIIMNVPTLANAFIDNIKELNNSLVKEKENLMKNRYLFRNIILLQKDLQE